MRGYGNVNHCKFSGKKNLNCSKANAKYWANVSQLEGTPANTQETSLQNECKYKKISGVMG